MPSLYIHIPFCLKKCIYCDFVSVPYDSHLAGEYVSALERELLLRGPAEPSTVYIGGGTPTVLSKEHLRRLFDAINKSFILKDDTEITIEANPGTIDRQKLKLLRSLGINRISIGVQSFNDNELLMLGRIHTASDAYEAVKLAKEFFDNFSIDLIYAIPLQTLKNWEETLKRAIEISPPHISAYELTPEACTPLYDALSKGQLKMPDEDLTVDMQSLAVTVLEGAGLKRYEISNYARTGFECRHNLNYWQRGQYLGAGAGAHSFLNEKRIKNTASIRQYIEMLSEGHLPFEEEKEVAPDEAFKEKLFLGLRMSAGVEADERLMQAAEHLLKAGLMQSAKGRLFLTVQGMAVYNSVVVELLRRLGL